MEIKPQGKKEDLVQSLVEFPVKNKNPFKTSQQISNVIIKR